MEEIIKLLSSDSLKRATFFVYIWHLMIAILLTNKSMNDLGYYFLNQKIELHTIIGFVLSKHFFYALPFFVLWTGCVFWGLRLLSTFFILIVDVINIPLKETWLLNRLKTFGIFVETQEGDWFIKDHTSFIAIQLLHESVIQPKKSVLLANIYTYTSLFISTTLWYYCVDYKPLNSYIGLILVMLSLLLLIQFLYSEFLVYHSGIFRHILLKYKDKGYYVDYKRKLNSDEHNPNS